MLRYLTSGESHGNCLIGIIENFPAGVKIDIDYINHKLKERQQGYGRGGRMKIETDKVEILSGVRKGVTIGSPITLKVINKDFKIDSLSKVTMPRPGHADLSGLLKYQRKDIRDILERASARETAIRVACGALCQILLKQFKIDVLSHVINIGGIQAPQKVNAKAIKAKIKNSQIRCADKKTEEKIISLIKESIQKKDTLGGIFEIIVSNIPVGLGSHTQWDKKLDARLTAALVSIQAVKGVEIGLGFGLAATKGSQAHDAIYYQKDARNRLRAGFFRKTNQAGGIEGGMSNGEDIIIKGVMKPIPTLGDPLPSVNIQTKKPGKATVERSDVCAVPACSVVGEAIVSIEIAQAFLEKFSHDSLKEIKRNYEGYLQQINHSK
ncbi:chorismate synthase [Candidatus Auribacterota bacterium]